MTAKLPFYVRDFKLMIQEDEQIIARIRTEKPDIFVVMLHYGYLSHPEEFYVLY